jgi:hypothetical protein
LSVPGEDGFEGFEGLDGLLTGFTLSSVDRPVLSGRFHSFTFFVKSSVEVVTPV